MDTWNGLAACQIGGGLRDWMKEGRGIKQNTHTRI